MCIRDSKFLNAGMFRSIFFMLIWVFNFINCLLSLLIFQPLLVTSCFLFAFFLFFISRTAIPFSQFLLRDSDPFNVYISLTCSCYILHVRVNGSTFCRPTNLSRSWINLFYFSVRETPVSYTHLDVYKRQGKTISCCEA